MIEFVRNTLSEVREYHTHMQAIKRSQAPLPSQANDDLVILDKIESDQVSIWKSTKVFFWIVTNHLILKLAMCVHICDDAC